MRDEFDVEDGLSNRLRALGQFPVDPATQSQHLTAMAEAAAAPTLLGSLAGRVRVAAALVAGFMLGTTGLASAGALGPLQPIAATAIEAVTPLNVPDGHAGTERYKGAECAGVDASEYRNHGQYIKAVREAGGTEADIKTAAESRCGKPLQAGEEGDEVEAPEGENRGQSEGKANKGGAKAAEAKGRAANAGKGAGAANAEDPEAADAEAACADDAAEAAESGSANADDHAAPPVGDDTECAAEQTDAAAAPAATDTDPPAADEAEEGLTTAEEAENTDTTSTEDDTTSPEDTPGS